MSIPTAAQPASIDPFADRRATPRVSVALPGFVTVDGNRYSVQLLDISAGGAKLALSKDVLINGETIELDCGTVLRQATVRWSGGGVAGVSFNDELNARETAALVERSTALDRRMNPGR